MVFGACAGSGWEILPPSRSAELRAPLITQRTAELKAFSHLWGTFGRGRSHTPESFRAARERAVWAGRRGGRFGIRNASRRCKASPFPLSRLQCCQAGRATSIGERRDPPTLPPAGSLAGDTKEPRGLTSVLRHPGGEADAGRDGTRQGCQM